MIARAILVSWFFFFSSPFPAAAQPQRPELRAWELLDGDEQYLDRMLALAPAYGINSVQFSHGVVHHAHQVLQDTSKAAMLRRLIARAHKHHLQAFIWTHELEHVPARFINDNRLQFDDPELWRWLAQKYERLYRLLPELDGLVLTLTETEYRANDERRVHSTLPAGERLARLANAINRVGLALGKQLVVRTFAQTPQQMSGLKPALALMDTSIIIMTKCVPFDWNPHFPDNPLIGAVAPHQQII